MLTLRASSAVTSADSTVFYRFDFSGNNNHQVESNGFPFYKTTILRRVVGSGAYSHVNLFLEGGAVIETYGAFPAFFLLDGAVTGGSDHAFKGHYYDKGARENYMIDETAIYRVNSQEVVGLISMFGSISGDLRV